MNKRWHLTVLLVVILIVSGCGSGSQANKPQADTPKTGDGGSNQPVTLSLYQQSAKLSDEEFQQMIVEPVKQKYPYITINLVRTGANNKPEDLVAAGQYPDMAFLSPGALTNTDNLKVIEDLNPFVKKYNLDLKKFDPDALTAIYNICGANRLCSLPFSINPAALFYNKDLFDKFGVPYPKDGMTWDDAIAVAKKVTRLADGIQYRGLNAGLVGWMNTQLSTPLVNPSTNQANLLDDNFKKSFQKYMEIREIPGNKRQGDQVSAFLKEQDTAMLTYNIGGVIGPLVQLLREGKPFSWDMASVPTFKEAPKKSFQSDYHLLAMSTTSPHKDEVFKVFQLIMDKAAQTIITQQGRVSSLKDAEVKGHFGEVVPELKGKNSKALFVNESATVPFHEYNDLVNPLLNNALRDVDAGKKDINTALRDAQEAANAAIKDAMSKK
jgi:multiple sugar transport system substrate-binding protein